MKEYGQYCPVARATEILAERWTLLVIRELLWGNERFSAIARGVPRMSPALLSSRLRELTRAGIVERWTENGEPRYRLTPAGAELRPIVEQIGGWGARWMQAIRPDEFDPVLLMVDMGREIDPAGLPARRSVVEIDFTGAPAAVRRWWLVLASTGLDVCDRDPGFVVDAWLRAAPETLTRIWLGEVAWADALRVGSLDLTGDAGVVRQLPGWLGLSRFAAVPKAADPLPR